MVDPIKESDLAAAAAMFPPVECVCETCNGEKSIPDPASLHSTPPKVPCPTCEGWGRFYRQMDSREEHFYIMHLLQRYQLR